MFGRIYAAEPPRLGPVFVPKLKHSGVFAGAENPETCLSGISALLAQEPRGALVTSRCTLPRSLQVRRAALRKHVGHCKPQCLPGMGGFPLRCRLRLYARHPRVATSPKQVHIS